MKRKELEILALEKCPPEVYYELVDAIEETSDNELWAIIRDPEAEAKKWSETSTF